LAGNRFYGKFVGRKLWSHRVVLTNEIASATAHHDKLATRPPVALKRLSLAADQFMWSGHRQRIQAQTP